MNEFINKSTNKRINSNERREREERERREREKRERREKEEREEIEERREKFLSLQNTFLHFFKWIYNICYIYFCMEIMGIDPIASRMRSERSTI